MLKNEKNYILFSLLVFTLQSYAQNNTKDKEIRTYIIEYDFQTGKFPNGKIIRPRVNVPVVFKITNINRLAYSVNIKAKDSTIALSDIPKQFEFITKKEIDATKQSIADVKTPTLPTNTALKTTDYLVKPDETVVKQSNLKLTEAKSSQNDTSTVVIPDKNKTVLDAELLEYLDLQKKLTTIYFDVSTRFRKLSSLLDDYLMVSVTLNDPLLTEKLYVEKYKTSCDQIKQSIETNKSVYSDFISAISDFKIEYASLKSNNSLSKKYNDGGIQKITALAAYQDQDVDKMKEIIDKLDFKKIRYDLEQFTRLFDNPLLFEYTSSPIQATQDLAIFKINIEKKQKDNSPFYDERKFDYNAFTRHGIRLDASLGIAGSFSPNTSVYALNVNSADKKQIAELNKSQFNPSFVGFFTTSFRSATHFTGGLSLGVGFNVEDGKLILDNFYVGPSLIIGKFERITLTGGGTFKNLPRLNDTFNVGDIVDNGYTLDNITTKAYKIGYFLGISYNLTKGVKDQLKFLK